MKISQTTFDDAVLQNIEDFDMEVDDAINEAIEEFTKMGADLSDIIKTNPRNRASTPSHPAIDSIQKIFQYILNPDGGIDLLKHLEIINNSAKNQDDRIIIINGQGLESLLQLLNKVYNNNIYIDVLLSCIQNIIKLNVNYQKQSNKFGELSALLLNCTKIYMNDEKILYRVLSTIYSFIYKCEDNKLQLIEAKFLEVIAEIYSLYIDRNIDIVKQLLLIVITFCKDDDVTVSSSSSFNNARFLCEKYEFHVLALNFLDKHQRDNELVVTALTFLTVMSVNNEYCNCLSERNVGSLLLDIILNNMENHIVLSGVLVSIKSLIRSDVIKSQIINSDKYLVILESLLRDNISNQKLVSNIIPLISGLTLRSSDNVHVIINRGFGPLLIEALRIHIDNQRIIKFICLSIRNIVCRNKEYVNMFTTEGVEAILRKYIDDNPKSLEYVFGTLRDLNCNIEGLNSGAKTIHLGVGGAVIPTEELA